MSRSGLVDIAASQEPDGREVVIPELHLGDDIGDHITDIITEADVLVPCWGNTSKIPPKHAYAVDIMLDALMTSGKPVKCFGFTKSGDPKHPLMLGYDTELVDWKFQ